MNTIVRGKLMTQSTNLKNFFMGYIPSYIVGAGKTYLAIETELGIVKITINSLSKYFTKQTSLFPDLNLKLGGITPSQIDYIEAELAELSLEWFRYINFNQAKHKLAGY